MKGTVILLKDWDEYNETYVVTDVYYTQIENFDLNKEYKNHIVKIWKENNIPVNKDGHLKSPIRKEYKKFLKLMNTLTIPIQKFIEEIIKAEKINYTTEE